MTLSQGAIWEDSNIKLPSASVKPSKLKGQARRSVYSDASNCHLHVQCRLGEASNDDAERKGKGRFVRDKLAIQGIRVTDNDQIPTRIQWVA